MNHRYMTLPNTADVAGFEDCFAETIHFDITKEPESATLTFIIPVISRESSCDWKTIQRNLSMTLASVENQTNPDWRVLIVSQTKPDVNYIENKIVYVPAEFDSPQKCADISRLSARETVLYRRINDLDRMRKLRVAAQTLHKYKSEFVMILEADDFVSNRLCEYVAENRDCNGWCIDSGYIWDGSADFMRPTNRLMSMCGSSSIVKVDYESLPREIPISIDPATLNLLPSGCPFLDHVHNEMRNSMEQIGLPLKTLPFPGVVYHQGHGLNVSALFCDTTHSTRVTSKLRMLRLVRNVLTRRRCKNMNLFITQPVRSEFGV